MKYCAMVLALALGGCAVVARNDARQDYQVSAAAYKACLTTNPPQACENARLVMETDERKFNALSASMDPGGQRAGTLTVLNR